ncbi:MAG: ATP synthase F0 subunit B [Deltaproteobacteria bacterium]|nr:ATP synthase F0 subunit B [Deltaproteobacteria bacterium]
MSCYIGKNGSCALGAVGALIVLFLVCGLAVASGGGEPGGAHDSGKLLDLLYRAINFALLVIILYMVLKKTSIKDFFANRRAEIENNFEELNKKKKLAEIHYQELEKKLREFESNKKEIIEQYEAEGVAVKEKIIAEAEQRAAQILQQAELTIQREIQAAGDKLKREVLDSAAKKAQEILVKEMKESDQDHLVDEFIKTVGKLH